MRKPRFAVVVLSVAAATVVCAHDTWLLARAALPDSSGGVVLDLTSGMSFPELDHAITVDRLARARIRIRGRSNDIREMAGETHSLVLRSAVRRQWANRTPGARWREVYVKHAKTFVGTADDADRSFALPVAMSFELVPESDPRRLRAADEIALRLFKDGAPIAGLAVGAVRECDTHGSSRKADADGRLRIRLEHSGRWMLRATDLRQSGTGDKTWRSHFTTLTIDVR